MDSGKTVSYTHLDVYKRQDVYTGGSRSVGYVRNTDREKQYARSVVNQQISNLFSKNGISISKQADLTFSIDPYTYQLTVSGLSLIHIYMNKLGRYDLQMFYMRNMNTYLNASSKHK